MARTAIKSTYSLDVETVRKLKRLASRWQVTKSEVLRRVIDEASTSHEPTKLTLPEALEKLQQSMSLTKAQVEKWSEMFAEKESLVPPSVDGLANNSLGHELPDPCLEDAFARGQDSAPMDRERFSPDNKRNRVI